MRRLVMVAIRRARVLAINLASRLVGSRRTRRFLWAQWAMVRLASLKRMRPLYRRVNIEWDVPGHSRAVTTEITGPGPREVLVRTVASVVHPGRERSYFMRESSASFPALPGYSMAGEVVEVGRSVGSLAVGQLVATQAPHASLIVRPADLVFPLPPGVDADKGAFLFLGMTALHGLWRGKLRPGERVAVFGRGAIGQLAVQLARALGAREVVSVAPSRHHVGRALRVAAERVVATAEEGEEALDGMEADLTVEASGVESALLQAIRATRGGGRVLLLDLPQQPAASALGTAADRGVSLLEAGAPTVSPIPGAAHAHREAAEKFLDLMARNAVDLTGLIGIEVNPWEAGRFYRELAGGRPRWVTALFRWDLLSDLDRMRRVHRWAPPDTSLARGMSMKQLPISAMMRPPLMPGTG